MKFTIHIKKDADVMRIADYLGHLPPKADYEDVLDRIEKEE